MDITNETMGRFINGKKIQINEMAEPSDTAEKVG